MGSHGAPAGSQEASSPIERWKASEVVTTLDHRWLLYRGLGRPPIVHVAVIQIWIWLERMDQMGTDTSPTG